MKAKQEAEKAELEAKAAEEAKLRAAAEAEEARLKAEEVYKSRMIPTEPKRQNRKRMRMKKRLS